MVLGQPCASQGLRFAGGGGKVAFASPCPLARHGCSAVMVNLTSSRPNDKCNKETNF